MNLPSVPLPWSDGAADAVVAIRDQAEPNGAIDLHGVLAGLYYGTSPGKSVLGRAVRDPSVLSAPESIRRLGGLPPDLQSRTTYRPGFLETQYEERAAQDGAYRVGERHMAEVLVSNWFNELPRFGLQAGELIKRVELAELGPGFDRSLIDGRWHGMIDSNIICHFQPLQNIPWPQVTQSPQVTLWLGDSLLKELDRLKYEGPTRRVRDRAREFTRNLGDHIDEALTDEGMQITEGVNLRVWTPPGVAGEYDEAHLETALAFRERKVPIRLVTNDVNLQNRARALRLSVWRPPEKYLLRDEAP